VGCVVDVKKSRVKRGGGKEGKRLSTENLKGGLQTSQKPWKISGIFHQPMAVCFCPGASEGALRVLLLISRYSADSPDAG
jgi:hypothetical protein